MPTPSLFPQFMKASAAGGTTVIQSISSLFAGEVEVLKMIEAEVATVVEAEVETTITAEVIKEITAEVC